MAKGPNNMKIKKNVKYWKWDEFYHNYVKRYKDEQDAFRAYKGERMRRKSLELKDEQVIWAREEIKQSSCRKIAESLGISYRACQLMIKGVTYSHLNEVAKPQK